MKSPSRLAHRAAAVALVSAVVLAGLLAGPLLAQDAGWSPPESLGRYWFPDVAADAQGQAHIAWSSGADGYDTVMYSIWSADGGLSEPVDVQAQDQFQGSEASRPNLYIAPDNTVHMTYRFTRMHYSQAPVAEALRPPAWMDPVNLAEAGYFNDITADSTGRLHLLTTQNVPDESCVLCLHLFHQSSIDSGLTWSEPLDISLISSGTAKPQMIVDGSDAIHVVYESGYGGALGQLNGPTEVRYVRSTDGGGTWSAPAVLNMPPEPDTQPAARNVTIEVDKDGRLLMVYLDGNLDAVLYRLSEDGGRTWGAAQYVPSVFSAVAVYESVLDTYSMARDSLGNVHLVMVGRRAADETTLHVLHLTWNGSGWSPPSSIATYSGDAAEWPRIAVGNGNRLFVVWFVRNAEGIWRSESGNYSVFFSTRLIDAPYATPTPFSTPPPVPTVETPVPTLGGADVTPLSVLAPPARLPPESMQPPGRLESLQSISSENDDVLLIMVATLPAALFILALVLLRRARLRRNVH